MLVLTLAHGAKNFRTQSGFPLERALSTNPPSERPRLCPRCFAPAGSSAAYSQSCCCVAAPLMFRSYLPPAPSHSCVETSSDARRPGALSALRGAVISNVRPIAVCSLHWRVILASRCNWKTHLSASFLTLPRCCSSL